MVQNVFLLDRLCISGGGPALSSVHVKCNYAVLLLFGQGLFSVYLRNLALRANAPPLDKDSSLSISVI